MYYYQFDPETKKLIGFTESPKNIMQEGAIIVEAPEKMDPAAVFLDEENGEVIHAKTGYIRQGVENFKEWDEATGTEKIVKIPYYEAREVPDKTKKETVTIYREEEK